ncbi:oxygenase MpaB family protein [Rhodococcus sp. NPDC047139]|uniref:oxygenase MpaB family protein n=1 Tax=Rhodococcus sp. NPDC047139 TaxID=3155141 RepID=UPI0033F4D3D2
MASPASLGGATEDHGYFGPDSLAWRIFLHPATQVMIAQITNVLESPHIAFQYVLSEHDPVFGAHRRSRHVPPGRPVTFHDRIVRTVGVPAPILFGSRAEADTAARQLFAYHRPMHGTIGETGEPYSATSTANMLFAAVTIAHAALLAYEHFAYVGGRRVPSLTDDEVRRYLAETAQLAVLMGVPREEFPRTPDELESYYDSVSGSFYDKRGWWGDRIRALGNLVRPGGGRRVRDVLADAVLLLSELMSLAVVPSRFRRHNGLPAVLDPLPKAAYLLSLPVFRIVAGRARIRKLVDGAYCRGDAHIHDLLAEARAAMR